jgi:pectinesterase
MGRYRRVGLAAVVAAGVAGGLAVVPAGAASACGARAATTLVVAADGSGNFTTVQAAIDAVPAGGAAAVILVKPGTYHEGIRVPAEKTHLTLRGSTQNPADAVITFGNANGLPKPGGGTYGTVGSATATFLAADFTAEYLTFANSFLRSEHPEITGTQAVAVNAQADRMAFRHDRFLGHQDTLLTWANSPTTTARQLYQDCWIAGDVDFIFGRATAVFDHVTIQALSRGVAAGGTNGYLTAAATDISHPHGYLITHSTVLSDGAANTVYLGRPWHPSGDPNAIAQVVYRETALPATIKTAQPWTDMSGFSWKDARFFEYHNTGPGAGVNANRPQLTDAQASQYTPAAYLAGSDGWNPLRAVRAR